MRELTKATFSFTLTMSISAIRQGAAILGLGDEFGATLEALLLVGDNVQRGLVDLIAGLVAPRDEAIGIRRGGGDR